MPGKSIAHVEVVPLEDGRFRAYCPEMEGMSAEGESPGSAEALLKELIEERIETAERAVVHLDVVGDEDTAPDVEDEDR